MLTQCKFKIGDLVTGAMRGENLTIRLHRSIRRPGSGFGDHYTYIQDSFIGMRATDIAVVVDVASDKLGGVVCVATDEVSGWGGSCDFKKL